MRWVAFKEARGGARDRIEPGDLHISTFPLEAATEIVRQNMTVVAASTRFQGAGGVTMVMAGQSDVCL